MPLVPFLLAWLSPRVACVCVSLSVYVRALYSFTDFVLRYDGAPGVLMGDFNGEVSTSDFERKLAPTQEAVASERQARAAAVPNEPLPVSVPLPRDGLVDLWTSTPLGARFIGYPQAVFKATGATRVEVGDVAGSTDSVVGRYETHGHRLMFESLPIGDEW